MAKILIKDLLLNEVFSSEGKALLREAEITENTLYRKRLPSGQAQECVHLKVAMKQALPFRVVNELKCFFVRKRSCY